VKSTIHLIPWPASGNVDYDSSLLVFNSPITKEEADRNWESGRIMFETKDCTLEEEGSLLQTVRSTFGENIF